MAYIGQGIKQGTFKVLDTSGNTYNGSNTTFSLGTQVGSAAQLLVSHDGVIQKAGTDYTLATGGTQITFSTAPASGASIFITEISGAVGGTLTPSDTSVTADKLNSALLTGQTDIGANIADADLFLIDDGAGGTLRKTAASRLKTYIGTSPVTALNNATANELVTVGSTTTELDAEANLVFDGNALFVKGNPTTVISQPYNLELRNDTDSATSGDAETGILFRANYSGTTATDMAGITAGKENTSDGEYGSFISLNTRTNGVNTIAQRLIVDSSGRVNINTASAITTEGVLQVSGNSSQNLSAFRVATNGQYGLRFFNSSTQAVGYIAINSSSTTYSTSSDYRLKENAVAISDGITRLKTLKPYRFNFIAENDEEGKPTKTYDGFFAHEVTAVPEAINGEKDAVEKDADGKEVINPQGIDQSKLVPLLTAALQEAVAKIEALEARVTTLEG